MKNIKPVSTKRPPVPSEDHAEIEAWMDRAMPGLQPLLRRADERIRASLPGLRYAVKWGKAWYWLPEHGWIIEVVAYDVSEEQSWDLVPFARQRSTTRGEVYRQNSRKLNDAFWLAHRLYGSRARVVYGTAYEVPAAIGPVDVVTVSAEMQQWPAENISLGGIFLRTNQPPPMGSFLRLRLRGDDDTIGDHPEDGSSPGRTSAAICSMIASSSVKMSSSALG